MKKISLLFLGLVLLGWGCASTSVAAPEDFSFTYNYDNGSLPSPYHFEYKITVKADKTVELNYFPDYIVQAGIEDATPIWIEKTSINKEKLADLYQQMEKIGVFTAVWQEPEKKIVGDSYEFLKVKANAGDFKIPSWAGEREDVKSLYSSIKSLFSAEVWQKMENQKQEYQKAYKFE